MIIEYFRRPVMLITFGVILLSVYSCKKYLEKKPVLSYAVPSSLKDLQALLDQFGTMNRLSNELIEIGCDDYYSKTTEYFTSTQSDQLSYLWAPLAGSNDNFNWNNPYKVIYVSNVVLDQLPLVSYGSSDSLQYKAIKGSALFYRSFQFYELAQVYCQPYANGTKLSMGIPLRTTAAIEAKSVRATVQQTYDQIISDLKTATELLPVTVAYPTRPSKAAAYGLLARTYLSMGDYINAGSFANQALQLYSTLMDFQNLTPGAIPYFNSETIYYNTCGSNSVIYRGTRGRIDSTLYNSYATNDLRKTVFFNSNGDGTYGFIGGYASNISNQVIFDGIATGEMYLIRAEAAVRSGNKNAGIADLNTLLQTRWKKVSGVSTFVPYDPTTIADPLGLILTERRKELTHRGLRWTDIRRLNAEGANITLKRIINGSDYILPPNDLRWAYLLPQYVIDHSELTQNPR